MMPPADTVLSPEFQGRYLELLAVPRREPGPAALAELVQAHLMRVPFENVSKLYYLRKSGQRALPGPEQFLDGIVRCNFGGTCYTANYYFNRLLVALGYDARLCGADMARPDVHMVSLVTVAGREYLVDVGYAAPFLAPLPRDQATDHVLALGDDRYVLKPQDRRGRSRLELHRRGRLAHAYVVNPVPRRLEDFNPAITDSYRPGATFMQALLLARFRPGRSTVIHNLNLIESRDSDARRRPLADVDELVRTIDDVFGIPAAITRLAVAGMDLAGDAWR